ncbi:MAG: thiamine pyrophosphate-dependent enzyme [Patescibacteria group bacterium]|nr:pyruvate ferredoxin oxidoreductase [Patescibacteria group bacterium]MBU1870546.1 pyruvate ferredoxin oxidoreductase [Patescibacteria group bacterium]
MSTITNKTIIKNPLETSPKSLLSPNHHACAGCGQIIAARIVADTLGPNTIIANATGCLEVTTTVYPESSWGMPWIHSLFENAPAVASGIRAALDYKEKNITPLIPSCQCGSSAPLIPQAQPSSSSRIKVVAQGGDGSTFDIGFGLLSGMWTRNENIIYICYDNEGYMNTGAQASAATPWAANTTTTPASSGHKISAIGSHLFKKNMIALALAHGLKYVAQTTVSYPSDVIAKIKKAQTINGPSYIQILVPCVPGWKIKPNQTIELGKLAVQTGLYPIIEYANGVLTNSLKINSPKTPVEEYLKQQGRFKHLFKNKTGEKQLKFIQQIADENIKKYNL